MPETDDAWIEQVRFAQISEESNKRKKKKDQIQQYEKS